MGAIHQSDERADAGSEHVLDASFVRLAIAPSLDAIAAGGILGHLLDAHSTPYHASITPTPLLTSEDDAVHVSVGTRECEEHDVHLPPGQASVTAVARWGGSVESPIPALLAAARVLTPRDGNGTDEGLPITLERESGLGLAERPVESGLAHSTLVHGEFSGSLERAQEFLEGVDSSDGRHLASAVALEAIESTPASARVEDALGAFLNPFMTPDGPFLSAPGIADVFDVLAGIAPGLALAVASGQGSARDEALETWRSGAERLHACLDGTRETTHEGCVIVDAGDAPVAALARLVRGVRAVEPTVLVLGTDEVALASTKHADETLCEYLDGYTTTLVAHGGGRVSGELDGTPDALSEHVREVVA